MDEYPHGKCECKGSTCCNGQGPAAYEAVRDGRHMLLCTRCNMAGDELTVLVQPNEPAGLYVQFDSLGALVLALRIAEQTAQATPEDVTVH